MKCCQDVFLNIFILTFLFIYLQDKLLNKLEENEPELAASPEEEVSNSFSLFYSILFYFLRRNISQYVCM